MKRIRSWIVRTIFGPAQSEAPAGVDSNFYDQHMVKPDPTRIEDWQ